MKLKRFYIKAIELVLFFAFLLLGSCAQQYTEDIENLDGEVLALQKTDIQLRKELTDAINQLLTDMLKKLQDTDTRLDGEINKQINAMAGQIKEKMNNLSNLLNTEMAARISECDSKTNALNLRMNSVETALNNALQQTKTEVQKAMNDGDTETANRLNTMAIRIERIQATTDSISELADEWKIRLKTLTDADYGTSLDVMQNRLDALNNF
ncbi:MAG: hypothetical protein GX102_01770 [Porphyromonadaceae bacterium]|nr:hypothetical protein [Porphyromonadaceae bacterium]